jgi:hypothetical protein
MTEAKPLKQPQQHQEDILAASIDQQYIALQKVLSREIRLDVGVHLDDKHNAVNRQQPLIDLIRNSSSPDVRRLVSRFVMTGQMSLLLASSPEVESSNQPNRLHHQQQHPSATTTLTTLNWMPLHQQLKDIWPSLLRLPPLLFQQQQQDEEKEKTPFITASTLAAASNNGYDKSTSGNNACNSACLQENDLFDIAVIVPAYAESGQVLQRTLLCARDHCQNAPRVVVVVVNAGQCKDLQLLQQTFNSSLSTSSSSSTLPSCCSCQEDNKQNTATFIASSSSPSSWGVFALIPFQQQQQQHPEQQSTLCRGGRGPTLNYGAAWVQSHISNSRRKRPLILTFLHADTLLPKDWDVHVQKALGLLNDDDSDSNGLNAMKVVQACAFSFGHDLSEEGLSSFHNGSSNDKNDNASSSSSLSLSLSRYPWGIRAVEWLGNLRASWACLPYGDHVISMPDVYFHYLGGFPDQPIMEDYELMDLLRKRALILNICNNINNGVGSVKEGIAIIPAQARCSVRRWQKHGVVYTTLVNALIVHRYSRRRNAWTPDDVFDYYYNYNNNNSDTRQEKEEQDYQSSPVTTTTTTSTSSENRSNKKND